MRPSPGGGGGPQSNNNMKILIEIGLYNVQLMKKAACIAVNVFASIFMLLKNKIIHDVKVIIKKLYSKLKSIII